VVSMRWRPAAGLYDRLHDEVGTVGLCARHQEGVAVAWPQYDRPVSAET
jgi:hypothetical protein